MGRGGIDITPSDLREAPAPPAHLKDLIDTSGSPESLTNSEAEAVSAEATKLLPRETGDDIGMGSPVPLSQQAVEVITKLRNMKVSRENQP